MGQDVTDFNGLFDLCPDDIPDFTFGVRKVRTGTSVDATKVLTGSEWDSLTAKSPSESNFDTEASAVMGAWYDDLPEEGAEGDDAKNNIRRYFRRVKDSG